ncbi:uncharacterized protein LOC131157029 isoform X2 [Malania oleifera]|uniref:uncharacterized protein LOC131157029 isoform X2 n=1 Tax=Malania oleifera TaxID=397392 RepID=UPI0025ADF21D|nr:uncharacterized protein LOC131157029 isoform X2 [Malania oleifera]
MSDLPSRLRQTSESRAFSRFFGIADLLSSLRSRDSFACIFQGFDFFLSAFIFWNLILLGIDCLVLLGKLMVQLMRSGNLRPGPETTPCRESAPVKLEMEDSLEEEHGPFNKRSKFSSTLQESTGTDVSPAPPSQYNPLSEPSPLGLRLRKSPSLLDLIQMRLCQENASAIGAGWNHNLGDNTKDIKSVVPSSEKLKASNFPASLLRIGCWEYASKHEGDLVAKCYFAKHKLVWEVLEGGLKSKIEIQWSDIMGLKANCPDNGPGTLNVTLARQPLFFRETNPQPRKHTLWQATADFTNGQASIHREHFLQCPQGHLNKHFEKLIQCDMRLNFLSQQPDVVLDSQFFEPRVSVFGDPSDVTTHGFDELKTSKESTLSTFQDAVSPYAAQSSSPKIDQDDPTVKAPTHLSQDASSPSSVMDTRAIEGIGSFEADVVKGPRNWEKLKVPGLHPAISMSDLMNHIGQQITSGNPSLVEESLECRNMLEDIAQHLFSDTQFTATSDEKSLMSRVNSLCCLLQKDPATVVGGESCFEGPDEGNNVRVKCPAELVGKSNLRDYMTAPEGNYKEIPSSKPAPVMSRKDSYGDLVLHLPRIASLPKFLFNISEDGENKAR